MGNRAKRTLRVFRRLLIMGLAAAASTGCATARVVGPPIAVPEDLGVPRTVVLEPFFEVAEWQTNTKTEYATTYGAPSTFGTMGGIGYGVGFAGNPSMMGPRGPQTIAVTRAVTEKPLFARPPALAAQQRAVLAAVQRLRPHWQVVTTSTAAQLTGPLSLVRVIIAGNELVDSNRSLKNLAFGFGLLIWPLQLFQVTPVSETQRVFGVLERYDTDAPTLAGRLVRYPTQPDFAFNASQMQALGRRFGLDVEYEEGLLADESPREQVLISGFAERLAVAVVALVEESQPGSAGGEPLSAPPLPAP